MNKNALTIAALFVATLPYAAHAQGKVRGAEEAAAAGDRAAGPSRGDCWWDHRCRSRHRRRHPGR